MSETTYVKVDTANTEELLTRVNTALSSEALAEFLLGEVSPFLNARARDRFKHEGDAAVGGTWKPLTAHTQAIRAWGIQNMGWAIGPDHPINKRTGELEDYVAGGNGTTIPWGEGASLLYPDPARATGELKAKMQTAQKGRTDPRTPPRPVLAVDETDLAFVLRRLLEHIVVGAGGMIP